MLLEQILAQWQCPVVSRKAMNLLHQMMHRVLYRRITMTIEMETKLMHFFIVVLLPATLVAAGAIRSK